LLRIAYIYRTENNYQYFIYDNLITLIRKTHNTSKRKKKLFNI